MQSKQKDITVWLQSLASNRTGAMDQLLPLIYGELRTLARSRLRSEREAHTLSTTGLVHEAYLKFSQQDQLNVNSRAEFFAFASECMRRVLVDYARAHRAEKRGSGQQPVPLDQIDQILTDRQAREVTDIDLAMDKLSDANPRGVQVLMCRLFGGLSLEETANALEVSMKTVQRDWTTAIAWLRKEVDVNSFVID
ncbi:MAG: ECF-type sigma factor [Lysobacterales bacterium]